VGRVDRITNALRAHDDKLYCAKSKEGTLCVYRRSYRLEPYQIGDNVLVDLRPAPFFIFALTDTWKLNGLPREWGIDPIMHRIREIDGWSRNVAQDLIKGYEKDAESKDRDIDNQNEAFLKDFRKQFAKTTDGINTASMKKIDKRRKDGNHK
jgi:hypothetical protein